MEGLVGLDTIAELSLALAGFSSLLAVFRGGAIHGWHPRARMAFWILLSYSLGALIFALVPSLLQDLGSGVALCLYRHFQLTRVGVPTTNTIAWALGSSAALLTTAVLLTGVVGAFGGPSYRLYHMGVVMCLLIAVVSFLGFFRTRDTAA
jgi:hypothetical protein